jgi:THO complex subunit 4
MSGKLDQSLDEILSSQRRSSGPRRRNPRRSAGRPTTTAPVGGVQKTSKPARTAVAKAVPGKVTSAIRESKIIVSNLVCVSLAILIVYMTNVL